MVIFQETRPPEKRARAKCETDKCVRAEFPMAALECKMKQKKLTKSGSKSLFAKTALKTHKINLRPPSSRGGIRL